MRWLYLVVAAVTFSACSRSDSADSPRRTATSEPPPSKPSAVAPPAQGSDAAPASVDARPVHVEPDLPWTRGQPRLVVHGATDVPWGEGGEVSLLPFAHDPDFVEAWRYDACVTAGACDARLTPQPRGSRDDAAVGMSWEHARRYCETRGLRVQSGPQDATLARRSPRRKRLVPGDPTALVVFGFRCVSILE